MASKPTLSREYLYLPLGDINFAVADLDVHRVAFKDAGDAPEDADWVVAVKAGTGDPLFNAEIGEALAILVGPTRGDAVTTEDLTAGDHQVWVECSVPDSDERVVRPAGMVTVSTTGA